MQFKVVNKYWDGMNAMPMPSGHDLLRRRAVELLPLCSYVMLNGFQKAQSIQHTHFASITISIN